MVLSDDLRKSPLTKLRNHPRDHVITNTNKVGQGELIIEPSYNNLRP